MVLGNGYLRVKKDSRWPNSYFSSIKIKHCKAQEEYINHKADLIHSIFGGKRPKVVPINNNGYPGFMFQKSNKYFRTLHSWIYKNNKKTFSRKILNMLTPQGIAIWYMDDGGLSAKKRDGKIHAYELFLNTHETKETNQIIINYFLEVYDIKFTQVKNKGLYRLRCGTKQARKFIALIEDYVIPSMRYKIDMQKTTWVDFN